MRSLGYGGMGTVWVARNELLDTEVAIKLIRSDLDHDRLRKRLLVEAQAAARLNHPNIVQIFDVSHTPDGRPFIVMEMLRGRDLAAEVLRQGKMDPSAAVRTLLPVAHALAVAHEAGIVHRDLKPENIFLAEQEDVTRPILLDFGIAKMKTSDDHRLTQEGAPMGSPEYMSPEQARGEDVDSLTDIWALSMVLYETVTGRRPFSDENYNRLLRKIVECPLPPFEHYGVSEDGLFAIVERGLRKNATERWSSMRSLGLELAHWLLARGIEEDIANTAVRPTWLPVMHGSQIPFALVPEAKPTALEVLSRPELGKDEELSADVLRWWQGRRGVWIIAASVLLLGVIGTSVRFFSKGMPSVKALAPVPSASARLEVMVPPVTSTITAASSELIGQASATVSDSTSTSQSAHSRAQRRHTASSVQRPAEAAPKPASDEANAIDIKTDF